MNVYFGQSTLWWLLGSILTFTDADPPLELMMFSSPLKWNDAKDHCLKLNMTLAVFDEEGYRHIEEIQGYASYTANISKNFWVGYFKKTITWSLRPTFRLDTCEEEQFTWPVSTGLGSCIGVGANNRWKEEPCYHRRPFLCARPLDGTPYYKTIKEGMCTNVKQPNVYQGATDINECVDGCSNNVTCSTGRCQLLEFTESRAVCKLYCFHDSEDPLICDEDAISSSGSFKRRIRYEFSINSTELAPSSTRSFPQTDCFVQHHSDASTESITVAEVTSTAPTSTETSTTMTTTPASETTTDQGQLTTASSSVSTSVSTSVSSPTSTSTSVPTPKPVSTTTPTSTSVSTSTSDSTSTTSASTLTSTSASAPTSDATSTTSASTLTSTSASATTSDATSTTSASSLTSTSASAPTSDATSTTSASTLTSTSASATTSDATSTTSASSLTSTSASAPTSDATSTTSASTLTSTSASAPTSDSTSTTSASTLTSTSASAPASDATSTTSASTLTSTSASAPTSDATSTTSASTLTSTSASAPASDATSTTSASTLTSTSASAPTSDSTSTTSASTLTSTSASAPTSDSTSTTSASTLTSAPASASASDSNSASASTTEATTTRKSPTTPREVKSLYCACACSANQRRNLPPGAIAQASTAIQRELRLNVSSLSSRKRKKVSAQDKRQSSAMIGTLSTVVLVVVFAAIVLSDCLTYFQRCLHRLAFRSEERD